MIQLDEARLKADFFHSARAWQINRINTFDGCRPCCENTDPVGLEDIANAWVNAMYRFSHHLHFALARSLQSRNKTERGRLPTACGANYRAEFTRRNAQGNIPYSGIKLSGWRRETLRSVPQF